MKVEYEELKRKIEKINKNSKKIDKMRSEADYFLHSSAYLNPFIIFSRAIGGIMIGPAILAKKINNQRRLKLVKKYNELSISFNSQKIIK